MFGIGMSELLVILAVAILFIGPSKLPEVARALGRGLRELRQVTDDFKRGLDLDSPAETPETVSRPCSAVPGCAVTTESSVMDSPEVQHFAVSGQHPHENIAEHDNGTSNKNSDSGCGHAQQ